MSAGAMQGKRSQGGFTLLEVIVALVIGVVVIGGVMGLISSALHYGHRLKGKSMVQPILEAAAQEILADPHKAGEGQLILGKAAGSPRVEIALTPVQLPGSGGVKNRMGQLHRVLLRYGGEVLEFSILIPEETGR
ncbi:MAG: prepilin-type N-terminal cleavage/methylation domain-containing protein [Desulfobacteraceae bacterium]|nr:prepilin-type N-terminal cleavage/methylation domain-containing protein [Desulfobacteraceae bacterium]